MDRAALAKRLQEFRQQRQPAVSRRQLGERFGYRGESAYQLVYEWETDRRGIPAEYMPEIAGALGVTICDLYGVQEGHAGTAPVSRLAQQLADALATPADKIEIHVHRSGEWQLGESVEGGEFQPTRTDRVTRRLLERWETMTEQQRERLLAVADQVGRDQP